MDTPDFDKFLMALRAGDEQATAELVRRYEPYLRKIIRMRMTDPCLRRVFDSVDICQSVLGEFFRQLADGSYQFENPDCLRALLATMARNKVIARARHERRHGGGIPENSDLLAARPRPDEQVLTRDLVQAIRDRLSAQECRLLEQRLEGRTWPEIAAADGGQADALRIMWARAVARIRRQFELEPAHAS
jgi:DNA-directed RNA polymerase specialized sigma24 family protein